MDGHIIYCISNASIDLFDTNTLTGFTNYLPKNFRTSKENWEIGVTAFGVDLNLCDENKAKVNVIRIKSDVVASDLTGYSTILYTTALPFSKANEYFYLTAKNTRYFPLRNSSIKAIHVELIDAEGERLALEAGQPSIVRFHLRKKKSSIPFRTSHLQVDSKMDDGINPGQINNNFEVHLNKPIYLTAGAAIALVDISFPNSVSNLPRFVRDMKIVVSSRIEKHNIHLETTSTARYYSYFGSYSQIIRVMNEKMPPVIKKYVTFKATEKAEGRVYFQAKYTADFFHDTESFEPPYVQITIPNRLKYALGLSDNKIVVKYGADFESPEIMQNNIDVAGENSKAFTLRWEEDISVSLMPFRGYITVEDGIVHTAASLIDRLNANLDENLKQIVEISNHEGRLKIVRTDSHLSNDIFVQFPTELRGLFGLNQNDEILTLSDQHPQYTCNQRPNLYSLYPGVMMCYTNFINHSITGNDFYSVFKMIPLSKINEEDNYISVHFENLEFQKCNTSRLDILHFQLKRLDGRYVDFANNKKILLNLAIRNPR